MCFRPNEMHIKEGIAYDKHTGNKKNIYVCMHA